MNEVPNSSFIPKRTPTQNTRQVRRKNFFVFSIFSYALFVAAPIASGVVFIYEKYTDKIFDQAVIDLDSAIQGFSESDLERVTEFDSRLEHVEEIIFNQLSYNKVLQILENNTTAGVQFTGLEIKRTDDSGLLVLGTLVSETFDATLFQKEIIQKISEATGAELAEFVYTPAGAPDAESAAAAPAASDDEAVASDKPIQFKLRMSFDRTAVAVAVPSTGGGAVDVLMENSSVTTSSTPVESIATTTDVIDTADTPVTDTNASADTNVDTI